MVIALGMAALAAVKGQGSYDSSGAWLGFGDDKPPPEDPEIVKQRVRRLKEIILATGEVPF